MQDLAILLLPLAAFLVLRLEYKLIFGPWRVSKSHALEHLGWLRCPDQDCMIKDGIRADLRLSTREILEDYRQKMGERNG